MRRDERIRFVQDRLLAWWRAAAREMPWRGTDDPYAIWVSEIMLQQTRVATVREYYGRFLRRFPTPEALAAADLADVLKAWEGMGYYTRARHLHAAAGVVVREFGGRVPGTLEELRRLPGVGAYTAGAIASIAHGLDEPVVDGNVTRVLCRVFLIAADPRQSAVHKKLWSLARRLIPPGQAGTFNQALMDLGATVCLPRKPACPTCCLPEACRARAGGRQEQLPVKPPRKALPHYDIAAGVIRKRGWILIGRRRAEGLLGGLWEFPGGKIEPGETAPQALRREIREEAGLRVDVGERIASIRHAYSHFRITLHVFECRWRSGRPRAIGCDAVRWVRPAKLGEFAFPRANRKIVEQLAAGRAGRQGGGGE